MFERQRICNTPFEMCDFAFRYSLVGIHPHHWRIWILSRENLQYQSTSSVHTSIYLVHYHSSEFNLTVKFQIGDSYHFIKMRSSARILCFVTIVLVLLLFDPVHAAPGSREKRLRSDDDLLLILGLAYVYLRKCQTNTEGQTSVGQPLSTGA